MAIKSIIQFSSKESKRFGYNIWRGNVDSVDADSINRLITDKKPDVIILRIPVEKNTENYKFHGADRQVLHCDTLVYYFCSLTGKSIQPLRNDIEFHLVTNVTQHFIDDLTEEIFQGYQSHYSANPLFKQSDILNGYKEWTQSFINEVDSTKFSWYILSKGKVIGFCMCTLLDDKTCEGVFSGIKKDYAGKGVYSDIVRFLQCFFKNKGMSVMKVSTQIQNYSVQKAWIKEGFTLKHAFDTCHINCFYK